MVGEGGVKLTKMQCCRQTMVKMQIDVVCWLRYKHVVSYELCKY